MKWNRSQTIALAKTGCTHCNGMGIADEGEPCGCVYRAIFRACYARFISCVQQAGHAGTVKLEFTAGRAENKQMFGRKNEEYSADFCLVSKRYLDAAEWKLFRFHFLLGADVSLLVRRGMGTWGELDTAIRLLEEKLGQCFANLTPYALYPLDEYFAQVLYKGAAPRTLPAPAPRNVREMPLRPPMAEVA